MFEISFLLAPVFLLQFAIPVALIYWVVRGYRRIIGRLDRIEEKLQKVGEH